MQCPSCKAENLDGNLFCRGCGGSLPESAKLITKGTISVPDLTLGQEAGAGVAGGGPGDEGAFFRPSVDRVDEGEKPIGGETPKREGEEDIDRFF